ncbi:MAG: diguanylate cyclase [Candidatus Aegiribacteria sp.]
MRTLRTAGYSLLIALFLFLASGRLLHGDTGVPGHTRILLATGFLLLSAALAIPVHRKLAASYGRMLTYAICAGLVLGVQLTGGPDSFLYFSYMVFLMWVSLPSMGRSATELGLVIGLTGALALLNSSLWTENGSFITRLIPLLLPALRALLLPFLFGLAADWLSERELGPAEAGSGGTGAGPADSGDQPPLSAEAFRSLIRILHRNSGAGSTCLFIPDRNGFYRLAEQESDDRMVISRFMLPPGHRLARIAANSERAVLVRAGSKEEITELTPYRLPAGPDETVLWLLICPLGGMESASVAGGFLLQDFPGRKPSSRTVSDLESLSHIVGKGAEDRQRPDDDLGSWMTRLVLACGEKGLDGAVQGMAGILSEMIPGATVSIADVEQKEGRMRVWVSRGPLARWRRGKVFSSTEGVAGWIVRNGVPCRRSRLGQGAKTVSCFSPGAEQSSRVGSIMGVPVIRDEGVLAVIMLEHGDDSAFLQQHESIMTAAAGLFSLREELAGLRSRFSDISGRDTLTGLPGITMMAAHLHHMAREVQTYGWYVGVIVADIDGFDRLNGELGYPECDRLLRSAAVRFRNCFPDEVYIARTGPDSFAACLPRAGKAVMEAMCQRAADALSFQYAKNGSTINVSASIGGVYTHVNRKVLLLAGEAEKAMARARSAAPGSCLIRKLNLSEPGKTAAR